MNYKKLGASGPLVSTVGFGSWSIGHSPSPEASASEAVYREAEILLIVKVHFFQQVDEPGI